MEFSKLIQERRSVRKYAAGTELTEETLREIIEDARLAPSWKNSQTARCHVALTPEARAKVSDCLLFGNSKVTENSCAYIVTSFVRDIAGFTKGVADNEMGNLVGAYDLGLYNAYLVLKAKDAGYDSLIMGLRDADALREVLSIPEDEEICMVIALGARDEEPALRPRKTSAEIAEIH